MTFVSRRSAGVGFASPIHSVQGKAGTRKASKKLTRRAEQGRKDSELSIYADRTYMYLKMPMELQKDKTPTLQVAADALDAASEAAIATGQDGWQHAL